MSFDLDQARVAAEGLNVRLKPIADRPVEYSRLREELQRPRANPLDSAGVREEAEALIGSLLDAYMRGPEMQRGSIRQLLQKNRALAWAAGYARVDGFRQRLLLLSALDLSQDLRDVTLMLDDLCARATAGGIDVPAVLTEVAGLSSDERAGAMGSVKGLLQRYAERYR